MVNTLNQCDICIVGDGAVGKAAALGLSQMGLRVVLLGASVQRIVVPSQDWDLRVYALNHITHDLLDSLKVWGALDQSRVARVDGMKVFGGSDTTDGKLEFGAYGAHVDELAWIVEDKNLNQALDNALKFAQNIIQIQARAVHTETNEKQIHVQLDNGCQVTTSLLIGADGAQSWVRSQADIAIDYRSYGQQGVVANFECEKSHRGVAHQWFVEDLGIIALLPLPGKRVSLVWSAPDSLAAQLLQEPLSALADRLGEFCETSLGKLTPIGSEGSKAFPLILIMPQSVIAPRLALIGDAAHVVHPMAGQGMNLGFGDVTALLKVIAERTQSDTPLRDCGDPRMLRRYQRARKEEVVVMQLMTDNLARLFSSDLAPLRAVRNLGLNLLDRLPVLKRKLISHAMGR